MVKSLMLIAVPICALLWGLGGASKYPKYCRRIGVGFTIAGLSLLIDFNFCLFLIFTFFFISTSIGYGVPDSTDEGSWLGRFWFGMVKKDGENRFNQSVETAFKTNFLTRLVVSFLYGVSLFPLVVIGSWVHGFLFCLINSMYWNVYAKQGKVWKFNRAELLTGAGIGFSAFLALL